MKKLTALEAKQLLEPIPKEDFITGKFTDKKDKCCAIGHLERLTSSNPNDYSFGNCMDKGDILSSGENPIRLTSRKFLTEKGYANNQYDDLSTVNNIASINGYTEDSPKDRVLHLLDDMIKAGY